MSNDRRVFSAKFNFDNRVKEISWYEPTFKNIINAMDRANGNNISYGVELIREVLLSVDGGTISRRDIMNNPIEDYLTVKETIILSKHLLSNVVSTEQEDADFLEGIKEESHPSSHTNLG